jgi:hypothetical protein
MHHDFIHSITPSTSLHLTISFLLTTSFPLLICSNHSGFLQSIFSSHANISSSRMFQRCLHLFHRQKAIHHQTTVLLFSAGPRVKIHPSSSNRHRISQEGLTTNSATGRPLGKAANGHSEFEELKEQKKQISSNSRSRYTRFLSVKSIVEELSTILHSEPRTDKQQEP